MPKLYYSKPSIPNYGRFSTAVGGGYASQSVGLIVVSSLIPDDLLAASNAVTLTEAMLGNNGAVDYNGWQNKLKSSTLYTALVGANPLMVFPASGQNAAVFNSVFPVQQPTNDDKLAMSLTNQIAALALNTGAAKSFAVFCMGKANNTFWPRPLYSGAYYTDFGYDGAYVGSVSDFNGNGDFKMADVNVVAGNVYDMNRFDISAYGSCDY